MYKYLRYIIGSLIGAIFVIAVQYNHREKDLDQYAKNLVQYSRKGFFVGCMRERSKTYINFCKQSSITYTEALHDLWGL